jgi:hypothetical protein
MKPVQSSYNTVNGPDLPTEYVQFLDTRNGGTCRQDRFIKLSNGIEVLCDCLFGFDLQPSLDFQFWQREFTGELPKDSVVIGSDPGGAFFILLREQGTWKLMYYDHSYNLPSSNDEGNTYECEISLHDLLALVTNDFQTKA